MWSDGHANVIHVNNDGNVSNTWVNNNDSGVLCIFQIIILLD